MARKSIATTDLYLNDKGKVVNKAGKAGTLSTLLCRKGQSIPPGYAAPKAASKAKKGAEDK